MELWSGGERGLLELALAITPLTKDENERHLCQHLVCPS